MFYLYFPSDINRSHIPGADLGEGCQRIPLGKLGPLNLFHGGREGYITSRINNYIIIPICDPEKNLIVIKKLGLRFETPSRLQCINLLIWDLGENFKLHMRIQIKLDKAYLPTRTKWRNYSHPSTKLREGNGVSCVCPSVILSTRGRGVPVQCPGSPFYTRPQTQPHPYRALGLAWICSNLFNLDVTVHPLRVSNLFIMKHRLSESTRHQSIQYFLLSSNKAN